MHVGGKLRKLPSVAVLLFSSVGIKRESNVGWII